MNLNRLRVQNGVAIVYIVVPFLTAAMLAGTDPKPPVIFAIALTGPGFWLTLGNGFVVFVGVMLVLMVGA